MITGSVVLTFTSIPESRRCRGNRRGKTHGEARRGENHSLPDHHGQHSPRLRAHGKPDTDLIRALAYGVRHHAVQTDRREQ